MDPSHVVATQLQAAVAAEKNKKRRGKGKRKAADELDGQPPAQKPKTLPNQESRAITKKLLRDWEYDDLTLEYSNLRKRKYAESLQTEESTAFLGNLSNYLALGCLSGPVDEHEKHIYPVTSDKATGSDISNSSGLRTSHSPFCIFEQFDQLFVSHLASLQSASWIRIFRAHPSQDPHALDLLRIYVLPFDVGGRFVDRKDATLQLAFRELVRRLWISPCVWYGASQDETDIPRRFDVSVNGLTHSLFYLFNTIPSPNPRPEEVSLGEARAAMEDILSNNVEGLSTKLYAFQRKSAAEMVRREAAPQLHVDPRLELRTTPTGQPYYYEPKLTAIYRDKRYFHTCCGGILAESMGLGKTLICISVILSTFGHLPKIPAQYEQIQTTNPIGAASLVQVAATSAARHSLPWRQLAGLDIDSGGFPANCIKELERRETYTIPAETLRFTRDKAATKVVFTEDRTLQLCSTTIVVVPGNLFEQWRRELRQHTNQNFLRYVLFMNNTRDALPPPVVLKKYVIILFSRERFEHENRDGFDETGNRKGARPLNCLCPLVPGTTRIDCSCRDGQKIYDSPLKRLHFLRLIIDEGHNFGQIKSNAVTVADQLVKADRRWLVSGTPAKDMLGVEVDLAYTRADYAESRDSVARNELLHKRIKYEDTRDTVAVLGKMAANFLKIPPWAPTGSGKSDWDDYVYRHKDRQEKSYDAFSQCFLNTLNAIVVKTRPDDVEADFTLPHLIHKTIRLEPSFYDKVTANLFNLVLTSNAVTSERTDIDYLFHPNSKKERMRLVANLRQSFFFWTGFRVEDITAAHKQSTDYLLKEGTACSVDDRRAMNRSLALTLPEDLPHGWHMLSKSHEIGFFVEGWPEEIAADWGVSEPILIGATQLAQAQDRVHSKLSENFDQGLKRTQYAVLLSALETIEPFSCAKEEASQDPKMTSMRGVPSSSIDGEPQKHYAKRSPKKAASRKAVPTKTQDVPQAIEPSPAIVSTTEAGEGGDIVEESTNNTDYGWMPHQSSILTRSKIVGTTSAKLSYLINEVLAHRHEKILIFYEGDNIAYYIAQALEIFYIDYLIYANSLSSNLRNEWVSRFTDDPNVRILLMDLRQGARGIDLSVASRVYFVNPVCRPELEAQAFKRAHRLGQSKPVEVQTLVLKGTIEEAMLDRSRKMTEQEHHAAKSLEDDKGIQSIIGNSEPIYKAPEDVLGYGQVAHIEEPQQIFGRHNRPAAMTKPIRKHKEWGKMRADKQKRRAEKELALAKGAEIGYVSFPGIFPGYEQIFR
ncbi:MAG: hypothetical protein M1820_008125 [Bogoriella megaspora]|nr:MAG: hypothetical protein M1820_008125 [Bogoriella megaspora]